MARKKKKPPFWSRVRIQSSLFATVIMNLNIPGIGLSLRKFCTPGFNCHGCAWATCACPIGVVAYGTAMRTLPVLAISSIVAIGIVFGRLVCAFVCPFGFFQDLLHRIPGPKLRIPRWLNYSRYVLLVALVFVFPYLLGFRTSGYLDVATQPEEVAQALLAVAVANEGEEIVRGVEVQVAYLDAITREVIWQEPQPRFFDVEVPPGGEEVWLDEQADEEFRIPHMPIHTVDGEDRDTVLSLTVPAPLTVVETDPMEQSERVTKATIRLKNLDTEPVEGVRLDIHCMHPETQEPMGEPEPREFPDLVVGPGSSIDVVLFVPLVKCEDSLGDIRTAALMVTSPQSDIVPEAPLQLYYCKVCPTGTLTALVPSLVASDSLPPMYSATGLRLGILAVVLVMMVFIARPFCRMFCPLGAIYSLFNRLAFVTIKVNEILCNDCGNCSKACPLDLDVPKDLGAADCIQCGDCIPACTRGGIARTFAFPSSKPTETPKSAPA